MGSDRRHAKENRMPPVRRSRSRDTDMVLEVNGTKDRVTPRVTAPPAAVR
jgi:hypothetical protein